MLHSFKAALEGKHIELNPIDLSISVSKRIGLFIHNNWHDEQAMIKWVEEVSGLPEDVKTEWVSQIKAFTHSLLTGRYEFKFADPYVAFMFLCYPTSGTEDLQAEWEEKNIVDDNLKYLLTEYAHIDESYTEAEYREELVSFYRVAARQLKYIENLSSSVECHPTLNEKGMHALNPTWQQKNNAHIN